MRRSLIVIAALILAGSVLGPFSAARGQFRETPQSHLEFGLNTFRDGFFEPAIDAFKAYLKAVGKNNEAPLVRYLLAEALRRDNRPKEAIAAYQVFLNRYPRHARAGEVQFRIGVLAERIGDRKGAIRAYSSLKPGRYRIEALYRVAALRLAVREWRGVVVALDDFIKAAPKDPAWRLPCSNAPSPWTGYRESGRPRKRTAWSCAVSRATRGRMPSGCGSRKYNWNSKNSPRRKRLLIPYFRDIPERKNALT